MIRTISAALFVTALLACASSSDPVDASDSPVTVTGRVTVTGSERDSMLTLVTEAQDYELVGAQAEELWRLQQRYVTVRGRIVRPAHGIVFPAQLEVDEYTVLPARGSV